MSENIMGKIKKRIRSSVVYYVFYGALVLGGICGLITTYSGDMNRNNTKDEAPRTYAEVTSVSTVSYEKEGNTYKQYDIMVTYTVDDVVYENVFIYNTQPLEVGQRIEIKYKANAPFECGIPDDSNAQYAIPLYVLWASMIVIGAGGTILVFQRDSSVAHRKKIISGLKEVPEDENPEDDLNSLEIIGGYQSQGPGAAAQFDDGVDYNEKFRQNDVVNATGYSAETFAGSGSSGTTDLSSFIFSDNETYSNSRNTVQQTPPAAVAEPPEDTSADGAVYPNAQTGVVYPNAQTGAVYPNAQTGGNTGTEE